MDRGLQEIKFVIKSLIVSCPQGMTIEKLNKDYRAMEGQNIPYSRLGFPNLELFLKSLTDTLSVYGSGPTAKVSAICDEKIQHIEKMVLRQKNTTRDRKNLSVISKKPQKTTPPPQSLLNTLPIVTFNKPPVYYNTHYTKPIFHPSLNMWVPFSSLYNYTLPKNYHWNVPTDQLNQQIVDMNKRLNKLNINNFNSKSLPATSAQVSKQSHCQPSRPSSMNSVPTTSKELVNITKEEKKKILSPTKSNTKRIENPQQIDPQKVEDEQKIDSKTVQDQSKTNTETSQNGLVKIKEELWFEEPKKSSKTNKNKKFRGKKKSKSSTSQAEFCSGSSESILTALRNVSTDLDKTKISDEKEKNSRDFISDNEAIPELAHNDIIFMLDYPTGSVPFGQKIPPSEIPSNILQNSWFGIFVTEVHNPYKFWFHIYKQNSELDSLMQDLDNFYRQLPVGEFQIQTLNLKCGQVCAALYLGMWHRGEILDSPVAGEVKVFFVDYGTVSNVSIENVKYLLLEYSTLSCQAYRGCLSFIKPVTHRWSRDATYAFLNMVSDLLLYAKATDIDEKERIVRMILTDTNDEKDFQINEALIAKGQARLCEEDFKRAEQGQPLIAKIRHFQEKYPTFDMLESGEYPSFAEIGHLLAKGIDFEARQDENILPDVDADCSLEEFTKELTSFQVRRISVSNSDCEDVDEISITPDFEDEPSDSASKVEPKTEQFVESKSKVKLNPNTNPFVPRRDCSNVGNASLSNQTKAKSQYNTAQERQMPPGLQQNPFSVNQFNIPMVNNMQPYVPSPSYYNSSVPPMNQPYYNISTPVHPMHIQSTSVYSQNWTQFTNLPGSQDWAQTQITNVPSVSAGYENNFPQFAKNIYYFR